MTEQWKYVKTSEGKKQVEYWISSFGRLKRIFKKSGKEIIYKGFKTKNGYCYSTIGKIHTLVANAFIPNPNNRSIVDHIDGNPSNNRVDNLRWCTQKENMNFDVCKQRREAQYYSVVEKCGKGMLQQIDSDGNVVNEWKSSVDAARHLNGTKQNISNAVHSHKTAYGYFWRWRPIFKEVRHKRHTL